MKKVLLISLLLVGITTFPPVRASKNINFPPVMLTLFSDTFPPVAEILELEEFPPASIR